MLRAQSALQQKLRDSYPDVRRWAVSLLPQEVRESAALARQHIPNPTIYVTRVGTRSSVWVGGAPTGPVLHGVLLWFGVAGYGPALVATRLIPRGTALTPSDAVPGQPDLVAAACPPITDQTRLDGMRAATTIRGGEVICAGAIESMPPVVRGEQVTARFSSHGVVITAPVEALSDGAVGAPVSVRNVQSGAVFTAMVTGKAEVAVGD